MSKLLFRKAYHHLFNNLKQVHSEEEAIHKAIGSEFACIGVLERQLLIQYGLKRDDYIIDVGCGAGRLAKPLSEYLCGRYLGIDIVPEFVKYAGSLVNKPDWLFQVTSGFAIPEAAEQADYVCFFSVLTHLLHEESYLYLQEAKRVLKPGGKILFTFLDFKVPKYWEIFETNIKNVGDDTPLNQFICKDAIETWAKHLGLVIEDMQPGDQPHIPLLERLVFDSGLVMEDLGYLGQSVCVLTKHQ